MDKAGWQLLLLLGAALLAACQSLTSPEPATTVPPSRGQELAQVSCSSCHAITLYGHSPNPNAPPFGAIANQEGLTRETLATWLRDAHNYPMEMDFYLAEPEANELVGYLLTLRRPDYRRPPD